MKIFGTKRSAAHYQRKTSKIRRLLIVLLVLTLTLGGGAYYFLQIYVRPPSVAPFVPRDTPSLSGDPSNRPPFNPEDFEGLDSSRPSGIYTMVIAGIDEFGLADTMMLVAVHTLTQEIHVVGIPRDTIIDVSWSIPKINSVIAMTNVYRLMDEIEKLTGFLPDHYITVSLQAFVRLVDALGGVEFNVPIRMLYDDPYANPPLHIDFFPGYQQLSGARALDVMRFRNNNDGTGYPIPDLGRIQTQQAFLHTVARDLLQLRNLIRLGEFAEIFADEVNTNIPFHAMFWYLQQMYQMDADNIFFHTMPTEIDVWIRGGSYVLIELEPWLDMVNAYLNPFPEMVHTEHVRLYTRVNGEIMVVGEHLPLTPPGSRDHFPQ